MTSKQFFSSDDFRRALDTIVQYKGEWYFGRQSEKSFHMDLYELPDTRKLSHKGIHADDEALDLGAAKLSLINHGGQVILPMRNSQRRYRYGTPPEVIAFYSLPELEPVKGENLSYTQGFVDMLKGVYPSVSTAAFEIRKGTSTTGVAVSRFFFLRKNAVGLLTLHFRDLGPVLWLSPAGDLHMVEKTTTSKYLTQCSKMLSSITGDLRSLRG